MSSAAMRPLAGLATVAVIIGIVVGAVGLFQGGFTDSVPLAVRTQRAGLVMDADAKVKLLGVTVGRVASIEARPGGQAVIHLEMDPVKMSQIPANVHVDIASPTVFGAKSVELVPPDNPSPRTLQPGQELDADHVTVELNTIFEQLTSVLSKAQPEKLNATLGAISSALDGRGSKFGQMLSDFDRLLSRLDPSLENLSHDLQAAPAVLNAYAAAAPNLVATADNATDISKTIVDEEGSLDAMLISSTGLADIGNDVIGTNLAPLTDVMHLLVPTFDLTNRYNAALTCSLQGLLKISSGPPLSSPGVVVSSGFELGVERYRYPANLPKVAAKGGPQCTSASDVPFDTLPPFVVADTGANPAQYGNHGLLLNSDALKQMLFGPIDGPPRNSAQVGQPG